MTSLIYVGLLFFTANSAAENRAALEEAEKLSGEVISAMEGNQATLDSVHSIQATIRSLKMVSVDPIGSFRLIEKQRIRYDGSHFRKDQLETKFAGKRQYRGYARAVPVGKVDIHSVESHIDYIPPKNLVFVRPPRWDDRYKIRTNDMLRYQSARGATLEENILASAENGYYFTAKSEKVDGDDCILLRCDYADPDSTLKIWVVPSKGYCIKKVEDMSKGKISDEYITTLKKYPPGIWWFDSVQAEKTHGPQTIRSRYSVSSLTFNEPIDPEIFTLWDIGVSPDTKIRDEIQNTMYTLAIDDVKVSSRGFVIGLAILALIICAVLGILVKGGAVFRK
jgi:hypothetical protein